MSARCVLEEKAYCKYEGGNSRSGHDPQTELLGYVREGGRGRGRARGPRGQKGKKGPE